MDYDISALPGKMPKDRVFSLWIKVHLLVVTVCLLGYVGTRIVKWSMESTCWGSMMDDIERGDVRGVRYWLDWGIDPNMAFGTSPLTEAKRCGQTEIVKILRQAGAKE